MNNNIIILAGGIGSRLWPLSSKDKPKQFLKLGSELSLLQMTIERALSVCGEGHLIIVTGRGMGVLVNEQLSLFQAQKDKIEIIEEPMRRNTAAAILLALHYMKRFFNSDGNTLVVSSDHLIPDLGDFKRDVGLVSQVVDFALQSDESLPVVLFGIKPSRPETGFGYIKCNLDSSVNGFDVLEFEEKPDAATARDYFESGNYFWNSGMFYFNNEAFFDAFALYAPELFKGLGELDSSAFAERANWSPDDLEALYEPLVKLPVDKAIIERSDCVKMIEASFEWSDVGGWSDVSQLLQGSASDDTAKQIAGSGNFAMTRKPVTFCGVDDLVVIEGKQGILVARRDQAHRIQES